MSKQETIKETTHFTLLRNISSDPYAVFHNKNECSYYVISKEYGTVETGSDSLPMALMYLHQAENGYIEAFSLFNDSGDEAQTAKH